MATLVTAKGREIILGRVRGTGTEPLDVAWGTGVFTAAVPDVALFIESAETRVAGTSSLVTSTTVNDTYQVVGTITATGARTITEVALSDSTAKPAANTVAAAGVVGSAVSTTLNTGSAFSPGNNNYVQIRTEVMQVTAGSGTTALTVVRAQNGSAAISTIAVSDTVTAGNPPGQVGATNGNLALHADFAPIGLSTNDSIQFTIKVQAT